MIFDIERTLRTVNTAPNPNCLKIFLYLAMNQPQVGIQGFRIEKTELRFKLRLGKSTFFNALHWLTENIVINEVKLDEVSDFMVNPYIVMNNGDRQARIAEWGRRIRLQDANDQKNRERRRRAALKKQNQQ